MRNPAVVPDPCRLVAGGCAGPFQEPFGSGERGGGGAFVAEPGVGAGFDELGEGEDPGGRLAAGAVVGALCHVHGLVGVAAQGGLEGQIGQHVDADVEAACGLGHPQGLNEVALGEVVVAHVERAPSGDPGEFGGVGVQRRVCMHISCR